MCRDLGKKGVRLLAQHLLLSCHAILPHECGEITRLHTYKDVLLASQPTASDFEQAQKSGVKTVINLRHPDEIKDFDEKQVVPNVRGLPSRSNRSVRPVPASGS